MIIYLITNKINGRQYIGQTRRSKEERWKSHVMAAKYRRHTVLGWAIIKYGKENFSIEEIDKADTLEDLCIKEAFHAKRLNTYVPNGYNVDKCGTCCIKYTAETEKKRSKTYEFFSPSGERVVIKNLKKFCTNNKLDQCHMYHVAQGKRDAHKGWRTVLKRHSIFLFKNLKTEEIKEVIDSYGFKRKLAREINIPESSLSGLISGKAKTACGWVFWGEKFI